MVLDDTFSMKSKALQKMVGRKKVVFGITKRTVSKRQDGRKSRVIGIILRKMVSCQVAGLKTALIGII